MSKSFWGVIVAIVVVFVAVVALSGNKSSNSGGGSPKTSLLSQHVQGQGASGVTLVEYGDYECPYCEQYYPTVKQAVADLNSQIKFQFRNFPLSSIHRNAFAAARAAEAAGLQNKFWEMHDALYSQANWQIWSNASDPIPNFNDYAKQLGLNVTRFKTDFASSKVNDIVNADMGEGNKLGITGTPTFYLDGKQVQIPNDLASFEKTIKDEIAKKAAH